MRESQGSCPAVQALNEDNVAFLAQGFPESAKYGLRRRSIFINTIDSGNGELLGLTLGSVACTKQFVIIDFSGATVQVNVCLRKFTFLPTSF